MFFQHSVLSRYYSLWRRYFGSPLFDKESINLPGGKKFRFEVLNNSPENTYIQKVVRDRKPNSKLLISQTDLMRGGILKFYMGAKPNKELGAKSGN